MQQPPNSGKAAASMQVPENTVFSAPVQHAQGNVVYSTAPQPVVIPQQQQPQRVNLRNYRGVAIAQLCIGVLTLILGIVVISTFHPWFWLTNSGSGIWGGLWITVTGIIGVISSRFLTNGGLNGTYMAFSIISSVSSFIAGCLFVSGIVYYTGCDHRYYDVVCNRDNGVAEEGFYVVLLILMIAEFFLSICAAVFCCQNTSCGGQQTSGIIITQVPQYQVYANSQGQTVMTSGAYSTAAYSTAATNVSQYPATIQQPGVTYSNAAVYGQDANPVSYSGQIITVSGGGQYTVSQAPQMQPQNIPPVYSTQPTGYAMQPPPYSNAATQ